MRKQTVKPSPMRFVWRFLIIAIAILVVLPVLGIIFVQFFGVRQDITCADLVPIVIDVSGANETESHPAVLAVYDIRDVTGQDPAASERIPNCWGSARTSRGPDIRVNFYLEQGFGQVVGLDRYAK